MAASVSECEMVSRIPIIVILGATGSGKSKLAIEIAKLFNGEIVSADSMQLYKGLDVVTNKVTDEERRMVPHHMIDFLEPHVNLNVVDYRNMALRKVEEIMAKGKLPLVVGGTNYYIESLLWKVLVAMEVHKGEVGECAGEGEKCLGDGSPPGADPPPPTAPATDEDLSNEELHRRLTQVDPERAKVLHPNNRRKILRSLQVFEQTGRRHSDVIKEQKMSEGGGPLGGPLRFPHSCILWLRCDPEVLDKRLDDRVDDMLENGLIDEMLDFHRRYNANRLQAQPNSEPDYTKGIFQSIGFKEFHNYLMKVEGAGVQDDKETQKLFQEGVELMKMATRRYARRQVRWVNNRFLSQPERQVPPVYGLDASDPSKWDEVVLGPASVIVKALMEGEKPKDIEPLPVMLRQHMNLEWDGEPKKCDICDRWFVDPFQWKAHLKSFKHKRVEKRKMLAEAASKEVAEAKKAKTDLDAS
ncbi:tRNA dimethylallyltransferase [Ischnura elegans]|uniref:tRNA dimethylallyltransferase n=1 Tax=Ischnura elegans TaxID=197161 RepID=UPI001ED8899A|nr:tRNA dimethylallyltransferase [Ischnura elegans]